MEKHDEVRVNVRKRKKELFVDRMGGKCCICGYDKCLDALHFHHLDKETKEFKPSYLFNCSVKKIQNELEKCILVCANCHSELHSKKYDYDINVQQYIRKWVEHECEFCHKKFFTTLSIDNDRKYCSKKCSQLSQRKVLNRPTKEELKKLIAENS